LHDTEAAARPDPTIAATAGFPVLLIVRVLTVLNDNLARWLVIGLGKRAAAAAGASQAAVLAAGTVFYVLPFILFAWLAGWLADRYSKRSVVVGWKFAELLIGGTTAVVVGWGAASGPILAGLPLGLWLLLGTTGLFALQTTLLNPSLLGLIPETVPKPRLSAANGIFALVSLAATLVGMAAGNWLADATWLSPLPEAARPLPDWLAAVRWGHAGFAAAGLLGVATVGWLASLALPRVPAADPDAPFPANALAATFRDIARLAGAPRLAGAAAGIIYFWAIGAVVQLNVDQYAFESGAGSQGEVVPLLMALVCGIGAGSMLAGRLSKRGIDAGSKVDLGLVPLGGLVMAVACGALAISSREVFGGDASPGLRLAGPVFWLAVLGIGAGLFDVPLEAYLQEQSPPDRRGAVLAATNLLVFAGMFLASVGYYVLRVPVGPAEAARPLLSARGIFGLFSLMSLAVTGVAIWAAPRAALRMFVATIVNTVWRFRTRHEERVPVEGPLVIAANHLSWLDGFLLPLTAPRPVRMVVYGPNIQGKFLNMLADQWRFILFDPKPKSIGRALKAIQGGLADGDCIGIFCEGGISRTGQIMGFKRGLEWLLERVESPILPAAIDGMWGSLLSYSEGRFFSKWPRGLRRRVTLTFGTPLPVGTSTDQARLALQELSAEVVRDRLCSRRPPPGFEGDWAAASAEAEAFDGACLIRRTDQLLSTLAVGDPLQATLGSHGRRLLGIPCHAISADTPAAELARTVVASRSTLWLARIEQVESLVREPLGGHCLAGVVMPIGSATDLDWARHASERFQEAHGIEPVVAYAPPEAGGLLAMNTPPARSAGDFEVTNKPESLGRVLNGCVVWPRASDRLPLDRPSLAAAGIPDDSPASLAIAATLPCPESQRGAPHAHGIQPRAALLRDALDVDKEGFLIPRGSADFGSEAAETG
jgi:acyl-[acyl-carrier-protein]-phospholipid O-acyltransferase/long-chain-fatty-acid--[acyl-carrier-protein] ligase